MTHEILMTTRFRVEGMDCASCAIKINNALKRVPGVSDVNVSATNGTVTVELDRPDANALRDRIAGLGYKVTDAVEVGVKAFPSIPGSRLSRATAVAATGRRSQWRCPRPFRSPIAGT